MVHLAHRVLRGLKVFKDLEVNQVSLARKAYQALLAHEDYPVLLEKMEPREMMVNKVRKEALDNLVHGDYLDYQECLASKGIKVYRATKVPKVTKVRQEKRVQ